MSQNERISLQESLSAFGRIGIMSFGGPAAQIALMHRVLVEEKRWLEENEFLSALSFCMLLPGPEAHQLTIYLGWLMHGLRGGLVAGSLFVLPGLVSMLALSALYVAFGRSEIVTGLFFGLKAAVLAIVLQALLRIARRALTDRPRRVIALAAFAAIFLFGIPFPLIILAAGLAGWLIGRGGEGNGSPQGAGAAAAAAPAGPLRGAPTLAFNAVFVMTQDNQIHALSAADGAVLWQESGALGQAGVFGVAAPAAGQGTVIAGYSSGELVAYRYENGRTLWSDALARTSISTQVGTLTDVDADPIIDGGRVYALGQGGRMAAYELVTGQRLWELNLAGISTPAVAGEWIFTLTDDARLLAIARSSGKVRWVTQLRRWKDAKDRKGEIFYTGPVLAGDRLWIASSRGELMWANVSDGTVGTFTDLGNAVSLPPIVANRTLYVLDDGGKISAYR